MSNASRFRSIGKDRPRVAVSFAGVRFEAGEGENLAAALLNAGFSDFRDTAVSGTARGPYCLMGACFDCLVEIDGVQVQACMEPVRDGLRVERIGRTGEGGDDSA